MAEFSRCSDFGSMLVILSVDQKISVYEPNELIRIAWFSVEVASSVVTAINCTLSNHIILGYS